MPLKASFLIAGAQKAGTSALHSYLQRHPELHLPERKELHFFDDESLPWDQIEAEQEERGDHYITERVFGDYHRQFAGLPEDRRIWGEATPIYMYWSPSMRRIYRYNKAMKMIVILRNPITRAFSHWNMERLRKAECLGFREALIRAENLSASNPEKQHRVFSYIARGRYCEQLRRMWQHFPRQQTLILKYETFNSEPAKTLGSIYKHLGVGNYALQHEERKHELPYSASLDKDDQRWLRRILEAEIEELEEMLGWDCSDWLSD